MGMFTNYGTQSVIQPNNISCRFPTAIHSTKLNPVAAGKPYEEYNAKNELIGYFWRQGETLNLEFLIDGEITVEQDAIIVDVHGNRPTVHTVGHVGQKFYNIAEMTSWTCTSIVDNNRYAWTLDNEFTYPESGVQHVYLSADQYLKDKDAEITIYNFRMEPVYTAVLPAKTVVVLPIDRDLSKKLVRGIYYCSLRIFDSSTCFTIFDVDDCILSVK